MTDRERFKHAAHLIIDALPDDMLMQISVTGKHSRASLFSNSRGEMTWDSVDLRWPSMSGWGGNENGDPPEALASRLYERAETPNAGLTDLLVKASKASTP